MSTKLSRDVLFEIFSCLNTQDLLNVSLVCHLFNEVSTPLLYSVIHLTWQDVENISKQIDELEESQNNTSRTTRDTSDTQVDARLAHCRKVCIAPDGRGEWDSSQKLNYLSIASHGYFSELSVTCQLRSSGWFKYIPPLTGLTKLQVLTCGAYQNYCFDLSHIAKSLPNLEFLSLGDKNGGFTIDTFPEGGLNHLKYLKAENCEWQYPSKLTDAAMNSELLSLDISYTQHMHAFAFSERFRSEFSSLPTSLRQLNVYVDVGMTVNWNPLNRSRTLPNLEKAKLRGFEFSYGHRRNDKSTKFPKLRLLDESST